MAQTSSEVAHYKSQFKTAVTEIVHDWITPQNSKPNVLFDSVCIIKTMADLRWQIPFPFVRQQFDYKCFCVGEVTDARGDSPGGRGAGEGLPSLKSTNWRYQLISCKWEFFTRVEGALILVCRFLAFELRVFRFRAKDSGFFLEFEILSCFLKQLNNCGFLNHVDWVALLSIIRRKITK